MSAPKHPALVRARPDGGYDIDHWCSDCFVDGALKMNVKIKMSSDGTLTVEPRAGRGSEDAPPEARPCSPRTPRVNGMGERELDGWRVIFGNYFPREVLATFRTKAEAEKYMERESADDMERIEPFFFDREPVGEDDVFVGLSL